MTTHVETVVLLFQQKPDDYIEVELELDALEHYSTAMVDDAVTIKISWMIENRNKWIYIDCDVSEVKVIK